MRKTLETHRKRIDAIDDALLALIEERTATVKEIGKIKAGEGVAMYDPLREQAIISRLAKKTKLEQSFVTKIFRDVITYCRGDERKMARKKTATPKVSQRQSSGVAVLGPAGTFTEQAAKRVFAGARLTYCESVDDVFKKVEAKEAEHGVVAVENSLEGSVGKTLEALTEYDASIVGEITLDISLCIITEAKAKKIEVILSHPHALAQCAGYLKTNYPKAKQLSSKSTAAALKELGRYENAAAIGVASAAKAYGLTILAENIQDDFSQTRFIVIAKKKSFGSKTSVIFAVKDEAGALYSILKTFADQNINLTKIESRPSKRKLGEYLFFMDFENKGLSEKEVSAVIASVKPKTTFLKVLGSY